MRYFVARGAFLCRVEANCLSVDPCRENYLGHSNLQKEGSNLSCQANASFLDCSVCADVEATFELCKVRRETRRMHYTNFKAPFIS